MPTTAFLSQVRADRAPAVTLRGFEEEFWQELRSLRLSALPWRVLCTGPCPNSRRVFFQLTSEPEVAGRDCHIDMLLGERLRCTRREAGRYFDEWINAANAATNRWLRNNGGLSFDEGCAQEVREFYGSRLSELEELLRALGIGKASAVMAVQEPLDVSELPFDPPMPDGIWTDLPARYPCGVFEAKLTPPPDPCDFYLLAAYAVLLERNERRACDYGVFLVVKPDLDELHCVDRFLGDGARDGVRQNIQHLGGLVALARLQGRVVIDPNGKLDPTELVRPPLPEEARTCPRCWYRRVCREQG